MYIIFCMHTIVKMIVQPTQGSLCYRNWYFIYKNDNV